MTNTSLVPFHLAFAVTDLAATRHFFESLLGCEVGRTSERWIDFNFLVIKSLRISSMSLYLRQKQIL